VFDDQWAYGEGFLFVCLLSGTRLTGAIRMGEGVAMDGIKFQSRHAEPRLFYTLRVARLQGWRPAAVF
jgi:hypothetical protein